VAALTGEVGMGEATAMDASGRVIAGFADMHGAVWIDRWYQDLGVLPGFSSSKACAVSADGSVVGGYVGPLSGNPDPSRRAILWTRAGGMVDANVYLPQHGAALNGWVLTEIHGVSADGLVLMGDGIYNGQDARVWLAKISR
jgi:hypothetical protein